MNATRGQSPAGGSRVCLIGAGHVGLVTAACFAHLGHDVTCMDIDVERIEALKGGKLPFHEPGLEALVTEHAGRNLTFTTEYALALDGCDFVFLAVATPTTALGTADLQHVRAAARAVARYSGDSHPILVSKSTAPVGITDTLESILSDERNGHGPLPVVANPEFLREGTAVQDFLRPDRVVVGSSNLEARAAVAALYESLGCPIVLTDIKSAEMIKYASNAFLATKISFINEIAAVCEKLGADVRDVARGMGMDPRIGPAFLSAGIGFGGSCLPKDVRALSHLAALYGSHPQLLNTVLQINEEQRRRIVTRLREYFGSLRGIRVAVLGLAFKPGTDDIRDAPALELIRHLQYEDALVTACDPHAIDLSREVLPDVQYERDPYRAAAGADAIVLVTEWPEFRQLDLSRLHQAMHSNLLVDGRNAFDPVTARHAGFDYHGIGLPSPADRRPAGVLV